MHLQLVAGPAFDTQLWDAMPGEASKQASSVCSRVQRTCTYVHIMDVRKQRLLNMSPSSRHRRQNPVRTHASEFMMMMILAWRLASSGRARRFCFRMIWSVSVTFPDAIRVRPRNARRGTLLLCVHVWAHTCHACACAVECVGGGQRSASLLYVDVDLRELGHAHVVACGGHARACRVGSQVLGFTER
jgi:hypothetical protein